MAILMVLLIELGVVNFIMANSIRDEITDFLDYVSAAGGYLPDYRLLLQSEIDQFITEESQFENRFFSVIIDENGTLREINLLNVQTVTQEEAYEYAIQMIDFKRTYGEFTTPDGDYYFKVSESEDGGFLVVALDTTSRMRRLNILVKFSLYIGAGSMILFVIILTLLSGRVIHPMIESQKKQKEFITNAGHELKTPLAIISANTEVIEMTQGKSEWTESTMAQISRLSGLINDLITLAKMSEQTSVVLSEVDYSAEAFEVATSFTSLAKNDNKTLVTDIDEGIIVHAEKKSLHTLVNILMDNAVKYCDDGGKITISLKTKGKASILTVSNTYADGKNVDFNRFFDRFYREDKSHNSDKKGYGIGLSMAESIVKTFKGKITVSYKNDEISFVVTI